MCRKCQGIWLEAGELKTWSS
ncbi:MAG: hypothetical protein BRC40_01985 [Cyanobacteria bacterium QH_8_48_120]|nr:MAG: hypothetical protein BRC34_17310 [Cyanobacteria bacterium QH_1_48_107]PSO59330.1 MAG: hypothetical protein BRC36_15945 [Cyanobacteria bacterium QH_2_48_84]PSO60035.1 MAG: hypothetical protein BRC35_02610 [Cyanobacteria bacterium QH_10_48_56]PSO62607.1 MAG: hypothetical protein BRC38_15415 [Cyanobacteria bacterium QH_6_48_35]PSO67994.1 MAG: hypothetical protein BRC39_00500 [Cyanobacteria bacterium QH_7_48_89]PSO72348.1 MAG: hypothetical protein BRC37_11960 [Cyanobacteria bacterium QH_3_